MNLAQAVEKLRPAILDEQEPNLEMLKCMAVLVELHHAEYANYGSSDFDEDNLKWAEYLLKKAKQNGWFSLCIKHGLLDKRYKLWPRHNDTYPPPKPIETKGDGSSVRTISGGAFEQNRRKH